jgi:hypothetical protein
LLRLRLLLCSVLFGSMPKDHHQVSDAEAAVLYWATGSTASWLSVDTAFLPGWSGCAAG